MNYNSSIKIFHKLPFETVGAHSILVLQVGSEMDYLLSQSVHHHHEILHIRKITNCNLQLINTTS